ncbi:hypothetical protein ACFE04_000055 [Oxalis oulophora]
MNYLHTINDTAKSANVSKFATSQTQLETKKKRSFDIYHLLSSSCDIVISQQIVADIKPYPLRVISSINGQGSCSPTSSQGKRMMKRQQAKTSHYLQIHTGYVRFGNQESGLLLLYGHIPDQHRMAVVFRRSFW